MLFILNRQEKVINILKNYGNNSSLSPYFDDSLVEMLSTGAETFSFSTVAQGNLFKDLVVGNYVAFKKGQNYKLFQIMQVETRHDSEMIISVYCECAGLDLINKLFRARKINSCSLRKFIDTITEETGWNTGIIDATLLKTFDLDLEDDTVYTTLQNNISKFEGEIEFRVELKKGRISNKFIDVYANRGKITGKRFVFGKDIEGITRTIDSTSLYTALKGVGKNSLSFKGIEVDGIDKPVGQDFVADQEAYERYNNNGYHIMGLFEYDTESPEELLRETYKQLQKVKEPKVTYEIPIALLADLLGKDWEKVNIGDTVSIFDNAFNPPLMLMARVSQLETSETNPYANNCTFTNFIEVSSNITDEMRKLASKLEGYVDNNIQSKFPIGSEDIQEGAVNGSHIYQNSITTDHLSAESITAEKIMAGEIKAEHIQADAIESKHIKANQIDAEHIKADSIESGHIKADQIESDHIKANQINANHIESNSISAEHVQADSIKSHHISSNQIETTHLKAEIIESGHIKADQIDATHIKADAIESSHIKSESIKTEHLQANIINSNHIQAGSIVAGSGIIAEGAIGAAQISSVNANVIDTGELNTSKIKIKGENGFLFIENNTLFVVDENRQIRCELGVIEEGTNYGFIVRGADGQTVLLDHNGVKNAGITDGAVDNRTVSENANISGKKLDIDSVIRTINEDGSVKIQGTTIQVGNTTLDVKLSEQTNLINDHTAKLETQQSEINANTESIKLKVDSQTYTQDKQNMTSQLEKNTSSIDVLQKEISLKVEETDITTAVNAAKEQLSKEIKAVNDRVDDILEDVSGAIADGIIDEAESLIIQNSLDQLNREKAELTQRYNYIYANTNLKGTVKNNLKSAYDDFVNKHTALVNIINTIISDKTISVEEKQNYNNSLQSYSDSLSLLNKRFDEAIESVSSEMIISAKAEIKITTDAISQNVSKLENTVSEKADGSVVTEMSQKMSTLETSMNGINGKVSSLETTTSTHTTELSKVDGKIKDAKDSAISTAASDATSKAAQALSDAKSYVNGEIATVDEKIETTKSQVAEINVELESITQRVQKTESTTVTLTGKVDKSIKSVDVLYAISSSSTTAPTTGWQSTPPTWVNGKFIWSKTTTVLTDGTSTTTDPVCITGATGQSGSNGSDGKGIQSIVEQYYLSTSNTTQTGGSWVTTPPAWQNGKYMWTRSIITYTDNSSTTTNPICVTGAKGDKGDAGQNGTNGTDGISITKVDVEYYLSTSATSLAGGSWSTTAPTWVDGKYMWSRTKTSYSNGSTTTTNPACITGSKGSTGATGATGATGQGVESITEEYYLSTSKTTQTGGSWTTTPPTWSKGKYIWTRSKIVYKNPTSTVYTKPVCDTAWEAVNDVDVKVEETKTQVAEIVTDLNSITQRVGSTETQITTVTNNFNNLQVGMRNVILNSTGNLGNTNHWSNVVLDTSKKFEGCNSFKITRTNYTSGAARYQGSQTIDLSRLTVKEGDYITLSGWVYVDSSVALNGSANNFTFRNYYDSSNNFQDLCIFDYSSVTKDTWVRFSVSSKVTKTAYKAGTLLLSIGGNGLIWVSKLKLEKGNKATDYTEAPEDINTTINNAQNNAVNSAKEYTNGQITTVNKTITDKVAEIKSTTDAITTRVSSTETNITNVTNNLNNMAIANRNEWLWSNFEGKQPDRITFQNGGEVVDLPSDNPTGFSKAFHSTGTSSRVHLSWKPSLTANGLGKKFLFSCWVKYSNVVQGAESWNVLNMFKHNLKYKLSDNTETSTNYFTPGSFTGTSDWKKVTFEYTYTKSNAVSMLTNLWIGLESPKSGEFWVTGIQVCEGNKLGAWTQAPEDVGTEIDGVYDHVTEVQRSVINSYESALEVAKENISLSVSQMYAKKDDVSSIEQSLSSKIDQTAKDISLTFNKTTDEVKNDLQGFREEITAYIRFDADGMELGKSGSKFKTRLTNEKLAFLQDNEEVAYVSNNKMNITDAEIKNQLTLGSFAFIPRSNGNLSLKWIK